MKPIFSYTLLSIILFAHTNTNAQMVGTDVFLKGRYVEVGIADLGYFGSTGGAPVSYHANTPVTSTLGFVADPMMDGWTTGTPAYIGDYFTPGYPNEGWEIEVSGKRVLANGASLSFNYDGGMPACSGANVSYSSSGTMVFSTWQGMVDSIQVTQITYLDTNNLYFNIKVILTNTAVAPKNDIYYLRGLDPDNDQYWPGGSFNTTNKIEHQSRDTSVVSALGALVPFSYMALGTTDTNATVFVKGSGLDMPITQKLDQVYKQLIPGDLYYQGSQNTTDVYIGLVSYIPHLATVDSASDSVFAKTTVVKHPANSATINYFYAFSPAAVDSAIKFQKSGGGIPAPPPILAIKNNGSNSDIKVYPNPSRDIVNITGLTTKDHISMYNMMGQPIVNNWNITKDGTNAFSMSTVPSGSYIIVIADANGASKARVPFRKL